MVVNSSLMLKNQVKGNLDRGLLEQNQFSPHYEICKLYDLVDEVVDMMRGQAEQLQI